MLNVSKNTVIIIIIIIIIITVILTIIRLLSYISDQKQPRNRLRTLINRYARYQYIRWRKIHLTFDVLPIQPSV